MAPSISSQQTDPLLQPKFPTEHQADPLPTSKASVIKAISVLRIAFGAAIFVAPQFTCRLFQLPIPAAYAVIPRIFGARELALGELLITAEDKNSPNGGRREIRRALWAGLGCDVADLASMAFGLASGTVGRVPALLFAGCAASLIGLGSFSLKGL